ncbi:hypothetical protein CAAN1_19S01068 [[Candida] anglica]|uniref:Peptidase A1 domain-containing protein n=1 Tax=[Candida] anglica TaxID=148631 RepID=A0ABP0E570_9ASCO
MRIPVVLSVALQCCCTLVVGLYPVTDFRSQTIVSIGKHDLQQDPQTNQKEVQELGSVVAKSYEPVSKDESTSWPVIDLNGTTVILSTDNSKSILYLNTTITSNSSSEEHIYPLLLDTGSSMSWIYDESCTSGACSHSSIAKFSFPLSTSTSYSKFSLAYMGDIVSGSVLDTSGPAPNNLQVSVGGGLSLSNYSLGLAQDAPSIFDDFAISGIVGIPATYSGNSNLIHQLYSSGVIEHQQFSILLAPNDTNIQIEDVDGARSSVPSNFGGILSFGSEIPEFQSSETEYVPLQKNKGQYWLVGIENVFLHNSSATTQLVNSYQRSALIDTGTTGIVFPMKDSDTVLAQLFGSSVVSDGQGNYAFPCAESNSATVTFDMGSGILLNISSSSFVGDEYTTQGLEGYCASKIQGTPNASYWVLGAAFLREYYTTFDLDNKRVGFAKANMSNFVLKESTKPTLASNSTESSSPSATFVSSPTKNHSNGNDTNTTATSTSASSRTGSANIANSTHNSSHIVTGLFIFICLFV